MRGINYLLSEKEVIYIERLGNRERQNTYTYSAGAVLSSTIVWIDPREDGQRIWVEALSGPGPGRPK